MTREHAKQIVMSLDDKTREAIAVMVEETTIIYFRHGSDYDAQETLGKLSAEIRGKE